MKLPSHLKVQEIKFCSSTVRCFFSTVVLAATAIPAQAIPVCPGALLDVPPELLVLKPQYEEMAANLCQRNATLAQQGVSAAQVTTAEAAHLPLVSVSSSSGLQKSWSFDGTDQTNKGDSYTKTLSAGVEISQSLWSGGANQLSVEAAKARLKAQQSEERATRAQLQSDFTRDILKIINASRSLAQREKELEKWRTLNTFTHRKSKSGHLSQRDTLQSDKETISAEIEVTAARRSVEEDLKLAMTRYDIGKQRWEVTDLLRLEQAFATLLKVAGVAIERETLPEEIAARSPEIEKIRYQKEVQSIDLRQKKSQEFSPDLRAVAGLNGNYIDNVNRETSALRGAQPASPNWSATGNVGLRFSMSLWNPRAQSVTQEAVAQNEQLAATETTSLRNIQVQCKSWKTDYENSKRRLEGQQKVLATVQALANGNSQLYEAGLVDTFQVIRGLQDLYTQERAIIDLENQMRTLALNAMLAQVFGRM